MLQQISNYDRKKENIMAVRVIQEEMKTRFIGTFPQGPNGEVYPIEWYVKEAEDGTTLISRYLLARKEYYGGAVTKWLKKVFAPNLPADLVIEEMRCPKLEEVYDIFPLDGQFPEDEGDDFPCHNRQAAWTEYAIRHIPGWQYKLYDKCYDGNAGWWWLDDSDTDGRKAVSTVGMIHGNIHPLDEAGIRVCLVIR